MTYDQHKKMIANVLTSGELKIWNDLTAMLEKSYNTGKMDFIIGAMDNAPEYIIDELNTLAKKLFPGWEA